MSRRVFLSSKIMGLEEFREAALLAIESLDLEALRAEAQPARPGTPQTVCLELVRQAEVVVLLLGREYGQIQPSGLSATEEEFQEAVRLRRPVLAFVVAQDFDHQQKDFVSRARAWEGGTFGPTCLTPATLQAQVVRALLGIQSSVPEPHVKERVSAALREVLPDERSGVISASRAWLAFSWCPRAPVERIDAAEFFGGLQQECADWCVTGPARLLEARPRVAAREDHLVVRAMTSHERHEGLQALAYPDGQFAVSCEFPRDQGASLVDYAAGMFNVSPRLAVVLLRKMLGLADRFMQRVDPDSRALEGFVQIGLANLGMAYFSEPIRTSTGGTPVRVLEANGPFVVPAEPQRIGRADLCFDSPQAQLLVDRLARRIHPGGLEHQFH